jgi:hypothetical protein
MTFKRLAVTLALVFVALLAWPYRKSAFVQDLMHPDTSKPKVIQFENGTVRQYPTPDEVAVNRARPKPKPLGELRKCKLGASITYTNELCPVGAKEYGLSNGTVNVLDNANAKAVKKKETAHSSLEAAPAEPHMAQRRMDQAIGN